jgi:glycosyltransferase involved in cell wall biosynthesis
MTERDLSLLVVSYYFPPDSAVGAKRIARFCHFLPEFRIRPIVLTVDLASHRKLDLSRQPLPLDQLQIVRAKPTRTFLDWYHLRAETRNKHYPANAIGENNQKQLPSPLRSLRRHLFSLLQFPDIQRGWYRPAVRASAQVVATSPVDAVLSSGPPWTAHAVGHTIARRYNLPWIADFRDVWASDPWRRYACDSEGTPAWRDRLDLWIEDRWVRHAAVVVCTTTRQRDVLLRSHPRLESNRVITIPNGYDRQEQNWTGKAAPSSGPCVFLHAGNLYGGRRIDGFCRSIAALVRKGRLLPDATRIILMGEVESDIEREARNCASELFDKGIIAFHPRVDWESAQRSLQQAHVLLLFQGDHPTAIPAKFFEYLSTGKPILALAGHGELRDIVVRTGSGIVADPDDEVEISCAIEQILIAEPRTAEQAGSVAKQFEFRNLTATLAENIHSALL